MRKTTTVIELREQLTEDVRTLSRAKIDIKLRYHYGRQRISKPRIVFRPIGFELIKDEKVVDEMIMVRRAPVNIRPA